MIMWLKCKCGLRFLNAVFAVISFTAASNQTPNQAYPTALTPAAEPTQTIGNDVVCDEQIKDTNTSEDTEANPEVGVSFR